MLLSVIIFGSVLSAASPDIPPQDAPAAAFPAQSLTQNPDATELDEVVVEGQRTREAAEAFVRSVAAPVIGSDGRYVSALNITVSTSRVSVEQLVEEYLPQLLDTTRLIAADLTMVDRRRTYEQ